METRKSTTAGVMFWTPAPARTSPTSSVTSEDVWKDEDDEQAAQADDFVSQMDENGIIGLAEALEDVGLVETCDLDAECTLALYRGGLSPQEPDCTGPEELSHNLCEHLSYSESPGKEDQMLSPLGNDTVEVKARTKAEETRQGIEHHSEREEYLVITEEEEDAAEEVRNCRNNIGTSAELKATTDSSENYINAHLPAVEPAASNYRCPLYQSTSPLASSTYPHLRHVTEEEMATFVGIEAETLPDMGFTESLPESQSSCMSLKSSPRCPPVCQSGELQPAAIFSQPNPYSGASKMPLKSAKATPSPRQTMQQSPEASCSRTLRADCSKSSPDGELKAPRIRTSATELNESRSGALSYPTPDFSKVEPRVHYPKHGYKPPKSKRSTKRESLSPEPPLVFKSPADIVKEVLLNTTDAPPAPPDSNGPQTSGPNSTVPQEFRCRQQATTLLEQLQEAYDRLLTKHAEAENTIDRLRLEAKVNLYSDPPKPGHFVPSGLSTVATKLMTLEFPQAQKADTNSASLHPNGHGPQQRRSSACPSSVSISSSRSSGPQAGQQPAKTLYSQAGKFLQQLQNFEDLLNNEKLKPVEQMKGLSQLVQGLDSLERGYLLARNEHKLLQQRGAEISHFDPERELDGLIFQCGLRMDELKEQVEQTQCEQPICEAPPTLQPTASSSRSAITQSTPVPLLVNPGEAPVVDVSSVSEENEEQIEDEEIMNSSYLTPVNGKYTCVDNFTTLVDHDERFKDRPEVINFSLREEPSLSAASRTNIQPGESGHGHGTRSIEIQKGLIPRRAELKHRTSPTVHSSKRHTNKSNRLSPRALSQSATLPVHPHSNNTTLEVRKSHSSSLSSLGEITASDQRSSKLQTETRRVLSQDGIISPETDSGFVGSESSHLTPATAPHPFHKRAPERVSAPQEVTTEKSQIGPLSAPSPGSSLLHRHKDIEQSRGFRWRSCVERRHLLSCSPQRLASRTDQTRADSGSSEFELESDCTYTVSEEGQSADQYTESISSFCSSCQSSSPAAWRHHGDSLKALSSTQVANRNDAIHTLQDEVTKLKDRLESCLKYKMPLSSVRGAPPPEENSTQQTTSTPRVRSGERQHDVSGGERKRRTVDQAEETMLRQTAGKKSTPAHNQTSQTDILLEPSTPRPQPQVSRSTQTSEAAPDSRCSHTNNHRSRTQPRRVPVVSVHASEAADEPDSRSQAPVCPQCLLNHRRGSERPVGGNIELLQTHSPTCLHHCPLCGCLEKHRCTKSKCHRDSNSAAYSSCKPAKSLDRQAKSRYSSAPPVLLQCTPVCPPPLLLYSSPVMNSYPSLLCAPPADSTATSSGVRVRWEVGRSRRSLSVNEQRSMDSSLNRAIRAARHMKHTSRHMAHSLSTGLHYQKLLSRSCTY